MARASKLLVFDWDDTILPFSFVNKLQAKNRNALPRQYRRLFREVEKCAEACLSAAAQHGEVSSSMAAPTASRRPPPSRISRCPPALGIFRAVAGSHHHQLGRGLGPALVRTLAAQLAAPAAAQPRRLGAHRVRELLSRATYVLCSASKTAH